MIPGTSDVLADALALWHRDAEDPIAQRAVARALKGLTDDAYQRGYQARQNELTRTLRSLRDRFAGIDA